MASVDTRLRQRQLQFMQALDPRDQLLRAQQYCVELRRDRRNEQAKRKRLRLSGVSTPSDSTSQEVVDFTGIITPREVAVFSELSGLAALEQLQVLRNSLAVADSAEHAQLALSLIRKLFSKAGSAPVNTIVEMDFLPLLVRRADLAHEPVDVVGEAAWILCNLASGSHSVASALVSHGAVACFCALLHTANRDLQESALNGLGNLALDCPEYRDSVVAAGAHLRLADIVIKGGATSAALLSTAAWTISTLVAHEEKVSWGVAGVIIPALKRLLEYRDGEVRKAVLLALGRVSSGEYARMLVEKGMVAEVVDMMSDTSVIVSDLALRVVGNLASNEDDSITSVLLHHNCLPRLRPLLFSASAKTRSEAYWTLSNITAGTPEQARTVLLHDVGREALLGLRDADAKVRRDASFVFVHMVRKLSLQELKKLLELGILPHLKYAFDGEPCTLRNALNLACALLLADSQGSYLQRFEDTGCFSAVEALQAHDNEEISREATCIIDRFFGFEVVEEVSSAQHNSAFLFS